MVTWPSAISTALLSLRTQRTVVPCIRALPCRFCIQPLYRIAATGSCREALRESTRKKKGPAWHPAPCSVARRFTELGNEDDQNLLHVNVSIVQLPTVIRFFCNARS